MNHRMNHAIEKIIRSFFRQSGSKPAKIRDIAQATGLKSAKELEQLRETLFRMVSEGSLIKKGKQFLLNEKLLTGRIVINKKQEGFVTVEGHPEEFYIAPHRLRTALSGDTVAIIPLHHKGSKRTYEAEVIRIVERGRSRIVGVFREMDGIAVVVPDDPYMSRDMIIPEGSTMGAQDGQKVICRLKSWEHETINPTGEVTQILGYPEEAGVDVVSLAMTHDIEYDFPPAVMRECDAIPEELPEEVIARRLDLRGHSCITIDPEDAKDFDDAVTLMIMDNGHYLLGVHIADVSYYVREGSALDQEAYRRGTSVYLVDRTIPMLPEKLSNGLCSLKPGEDRLAYSVLMEMTPNGVIEDYDIAETVIRSRRRLSYEEAQSVIEGKPKDNFGSEITDLLLQMNKLASVLTKKRMRDGSLDFDTPESKFRLDPSGYPVECYRKDRLESHRLIEEFMLAANRTVATHIGKTGKKKTPLPFLYRVHDKPADEKLKNFILFLQALGYRPHISASREAVTPGHFQDLLNKVKGKKEQMLIEKVAIRTMAKAEYTSRNIGHFGLAFDYYTHFTSPIRRYPDLIVHRLLKEYDRGMTAERCQWWAERLPEIGRQCSLREQVAMSAERDSIKLKQTEFMEQFIGQEFKGIISGVMAFGLFVEIPEYLIEGLVAVRDMPDDYYVYDEKHYRLVGKRTKRTYRLGDEVRVRLTAVNRRKNEINMMLTG